MNVSSWEEVRGQAVLGSEEVVNWMWEEFLQGRGRERRKDQVFSGYEELSPAVEVGVVAQAVAERFGVPAHQLIGRRSRHRQARRVLLRLCFDVRSGPKSLADIGMELAGVGAAALCRNRRILEEDLNRDSELARI
jgi:hypothetical protein